MANTASAAKQARINIKHRNRNRLSKRKFRDLEKKVREGIKDKKPEATLEALPKFHSALDKAVKTGVIHKNNAARRKKRIAALLVS